MFERGTNNLSEILVTLLAGTSNLKARELHQEVNSSYRKLSLQAIYQELGKLEERGVVLKLKGAYSLTLTWAFGFVNLADKIYDTYISAGSHAEEVLPKAAEKLSWRFNNLTRMDDFWVQLLLITTQQSKSEKYIFYAFQHPFYFLLPNAVQKMTSNYPFWVAEGWKLYAVFQADTYLLREYISLIDPQLITVSSGHNVLSTPATIYTVLIHPYIITIEVTQKFANQVDALFFNTTSKATLELDQVSEIVTSQSPVFISILNNEKKANELRKKFFEFHGLS